MVTGETNTPTYQGEQENSIDPTRKSDFTAGFFLLIASMTILTSNRHTRCGVIFKDESQLYKMAEEARDFRR